MSEVKKYRFVMNDQTPDLQRLKSGESTELGKIFPVSSFAGYLKARAEYGANGPVIVAPNRPEIFNSVKTPHGGFISTLMNEAAIAQMNDMGLPADRVNLSMFDVKYISVAKDPSLPLSAESQVLSVNPASIKTSSILSAGDKVLARADAVYDILSPETDADVERVIAQFGGRDMCPRLPGLGETEGYKAVLEASKSDLPGYMETLGMQFDEVSPGMVKMSMPQINGLFADKDGWVNPAVLVSMADAAGTAGRSATDGPYTMNGLNVLLLSPVHKDEGPLEVTGTVIKTGRKLVGVKADVLNKDGDWKATATLDCMPLS